MKEQTNTINFLSRDLYLPHLKHVCKWNQIPNPYQQTKFRIVLVLPKQILCLSRISLDFASNCDAEAIPSIGIFLCNLPVKIHLEPNVLVRMLLQSLDGTWIIFPWSARGEPEAIVSPRAYDQRRRAWDSRRVGLWSRLFPGLL